MGLWFRTAVSYVLVTLGAVLVVEAVLIGLSSRVISVQADEQAARTAVQTDTFSLALKLSSQLSSASSKPEPTPQPSPTAQPTILAARTGSCTFAAKAGDISLVVRPDGTVDESSYPSCYPPGSPAPPLAGGAGRASAGGPDEDSGVGRGVAGTRIAWAYAPVVQVPAASFDRDEPASPTDLLRDPQAHRFGTLYQEMRISAKQSGVRFGNVRPLLIPGLVVLVVAVPVGLLFGYVSMRRPVRRLRRLAATAQALADGDLARRIPVSGRDELSALEADINRMAQRLAAALTGERELAAARARTAERARIARELHDAVSQDLFSLRLLSGGVARALPADSPLREQVEQLERTAATATREMQAMLLELRPAALAEGGLAGALARLAEAYRNRVGIRVHADVAEADPAQADLTADREHALLRIAQEALANAVRHGEPTEVTLTLSREVMRVHDDGHGFDPAVPATGMGLSLMAERAAEVGAVLVVESSPGGGTTVEVRLT
jgi:signal transduction histidine kinase